MEKITIVGVDLAKNVFQLHAADRESRAVMKKRVARSRFLSIMSQIEPCVGRCCRTQA